MQDWQNTQFLHVFQEQLISGQRGAGGLLGPDLGLMESQLGAMVDLQQAAAFEEPFYIVVLEKSGKHTLVHMWRLVIASQPDNPDFCGSMMYVPDSQLTQDDGEEDLDHHVGASHTNHEPHKQSDTTLPEEQPQQTSHVIISTTKVSLGVLSSKPLSVETIIIIDDFRCALKFCHCRTTSKSFTQHQLLVISALRLFTLLALLHIQ
jgi:DmX-like protein